MGTLGRLVCLGVLLCGACSNDDDAPANAAGTSGSGLGGSSGSPAGGAGNAGAAGAPGASGNGGSPGAGGSSASGGSAGNGAGAGGGAEGGPDGGETDTGIIPGEVRRPNPLVSRTATVFSAPAGGEVVVDANYHSNGWYLPAVTPEAPAWVALQLAAGPTRLLLSWDDGGTYNYEDPTSATVYGLPGAYHIDVSADSTDGANGTWQTVATVAANAVRTRAHSFDFTGMTWVKLVVTAAPANANGGAVSIGEIDVHDVSSTGAGLPEDTWFFMGDSITAFAYDRATVHQPSFAAGIAATAPEYFPAMINGGIGGETSTAGLARLPAVLTQNPDYRFVILGYGTNDAANLQVPVATFKANMQSMIDLIKAARREPVIPHIPPSADGAHAGIPDYNTAIDELTTENDLVVGADLYAYFTNTDGLFVCPPCGGDRVTDDLHPNDTGLAGMNVEWTDAMRAIYPE